MSGVVFQATGSDLLDALVEEQSQQPPGNRNDELFRRTRVALEAGYDPDEVAEAMAEAGRLSGLTRSEVKSVITSALSEPRERLEAGVAPLPASEWRDVWERGWRVIGLREDKVPAQRWQYPWTEDNDPIKRGTPYLAIVIPPGLAVLDVDDGQAFAQTGLIVPAQAPSYPSISGAAGKRHHRHGRGLRSGYRRSRKINLGDRGPRPRC